MFLKQSTNPQYVVIGPFLDEDDGKTAETGLTISNTDIRLSKNGGNIAAKNTGGATHDELGFYQITLNATDTDTVGELLIAVHESGALPVFKYCYVLEEAIYDSLFAASAAAFDANQRVDVAQIEGSDATDQINAACDAAIETYGLDHLVAASVAGGDIVDNSIVAKLVSKESTADWDDFVNTTDSLQALRDRGDASWTTGGGGSAPTAAAIADAVWDEATSGHTSSGTFGEQVKTDIDAILLDTAEIGSAGAGLTAVPWNASWDAEVQSECTDALNAYDPPTKAEMDAMWTTAATESYASDNAAATPAQLLYMILCTVSEFSVSGTTITGKKLDGSTTAMTWTINDATSPTSRTRAS
jgi:hypothetical protein